MNISLHAKSPYDILHEREIRVLVLYPGTRGSQLVVDLRPLCLPIATRRRNKTKSRRICRDSSQAASRFEAISYCWGEPIFCESLRLVNGGRLPITQSLHAALQSFRYPTRPRLLWADAVCINQQDTAERSSQVALMGEIYTAAARVLVWLGEPELDGGEHLAFLTLHSGFCRYKASSGEERLKQLEHYLNDVTRCPCCGESVSVIEPSGLQALMSVGHLMDRLWFTRLWVVQEVALNRVVDYCCGTHRVQELDFRQMIYELRGYGATHVDHEPESELEKPQVRPSQVDVKDPELESKIGQFTELQEYRKSRSSAFRPSDLIRGLIELSRRSCKEAHDRIFAVRSLYGLDDFTTLRPDYSMSAAEVFRRATLLCLTSPNYTNDIHKAILLALAGTSVTPTTIGHTPSWVPDFHHLSERSRAKLLSYDVVVECNGQFLADDRAFECRTTTENIDELHVRGLPFAKIEKVLDGSMCPARYPIDRAGDVEHSNEDGLALIRWYLRCREFILKTAKLIDLPRSYHDRQSRSEKKELGGIDQHIYSIMCAGNDEKSADPIPQENVSTDRFNSWVSDVHKLENYSNLSPETLWHSLGPFLSRHGNASFDRGRQLCNTNGKLGNLAAWVPSTAREGDLVCYLTGAPYPYVLREVGVGSFVLLGDAYVHGAVDHQLLELDPKEWDPLYKRQAECRARLDTSLERVYEAEASGGWILNDNFDEAMHERSLSNRVFDELREEIKTLFRTAAWKVGWITLH